MLMKAKRVGFHPPTPPSTRPRLSPPPILTRISTQWDRSRRRSSRRVAAAALDGMYGSGDCVSGRGRELPPQREYSPPSQAIVDSTPQVVRRRSLRSNPPSGLNLIGSELTVLTGQWTSTVGGNGPGIDSYLEYLLKASVLFNDDELRNAFDVLYSAILSINRFESYPGFVLPTGLHPRDCSQLPCQPQFPLGLCGGSASAGGGCGSSEGVSVGLVGSVQCLWDV